MTLHADFCVFFSRLYHGPHSGQASSSKTKQSSGCQQRFFCVWLLYIQTTKNSLPLLYAYFQNLRNSKLWFSKAPKTEKKTQNCIELQGVAHQVMCESRIRYASKYKQMVCPSENIHFLFPKLLSAGRWVHDCETLVQTESPSFWKKMVTGLEKKSGDWLEVVCQQKMSSLQQPPVKKSTLFLQRHGDLSAP